MSTLRGLRETNWKCAKCRRKGQMSIEYDRDTSDWFETSTVLWEITITCSCGNCDSDQAVGNETMMNDDPSFGEFKPV